MASKLGGRPSVEHVSSLAEVVEIILSFLPARALFCCAQVSRLWRDTARRVLRSRQKLGWLSFEAHHEPHVAPCTSKVRIDGRLFIVDEGIFLLYTVNGSQSMLLYQQNIFTILTSSMSQNLPDPESFLGLRT